MNEADMLAAQRQAVIDGEADLARDLARSAVESGADLKKSINDGYIAGIEQVGRMWESGECFLPELMQGADAMRAAMAVIRPAIIARGDPVDDGTTIVIGTVQGDIHDIGKILVATFLEANGFRVVDLGRDVPASDFVAAAAEEKAAIVGLSALLTTTMVGQEEVVRLLEERGLRSSVRVLVGGAPVTRRYARSIGADGYGSSAVEAVAEARRLSGR